jgi:hypothetical protein
MAERTNHAPFQLTGGEKSILRALIRESVVRVCHDTANPDDRLAAFFGVMCGRAGMDDTHELLDRLLQQDTTE